MSNPRVLNAAIEIEILARLVHGPEVWMTPRQLASDLGRNVEAVNDALARLDVAGWLAIWEQPDDIAVTLSAPAARAFGMVFFTRPRYGDFAFRPRDPHATRAALRRLQDIDAGPRALQAQRNAARSA